MAAHTLRRAGCSVRVFEADSVPGGKMRTERDGGYLFEWGPQTFLVEDESALRRAISWVGLEGEVLTPVAGAKKRYLVRRGRLWEVPRQLPRVLSSGGLARMFAEPFVPRRRREQPESVHGFARRRFGREAARTLVGAFVSGVFAGDAARLEVRSAFPRLYGMEQEFRSVVLAAFRGGIRKRTMGSFRNGMGCLPEALAAQLGDDLALDAPVTAIRREGAVWEVESVQETVRAEAVVVTCPAYAAAALLRASDQVLAEHLAKIEYAGLAVAALGYDVSAFREPPRGFGFLVPRGEARVLGCLFPSAIFDAAAPAGKILLRVMIGGRHDPDAIALSDEELTALARREVEPLVGALKGPERVRVFRHPRAIPQYELGHAERVRAIQDRLFAWPGLHLAGNPYRGVSVGDVAADAEAVGQRVSASLG